MYSVIALIFSLFLLTTWALIDYIFLPELDLINEQICTSLQHNLNKPITIVISYIGTYILPGIPPVILFLGHFWRKSKISSLFTISGLMITKHLNTTLKIMYKEQRPFFKRDLIEAFSCECNFAKPSGHASFSTCAFLFMASDLPYILEKWISKKKTFKKMSCIGICSFFCVLIVLFSRLYLGVHTISQLIYGTLIGLFGFSLTSYLKRVLLLPTFKFFRSIQKKNRVSLVIAIGLVVLVVVGYTTANYYLAKRSLSPLNSEVSQLSKKKCQNCLEIMGLDTLKGLILIYVFPGLFLSLTLLSLIEVEDLPGGLKKKDIFVRSILFAGGWLCSASIVILVALLYKQVQRIGHLVLIALLELTQVLIFYTGAPYIAAVLGYQSPTDFLGDMDRELSEVADKVAGVRKAKKFKRGTEEIESQENIGSNIGDKELELEDFEEHGEKRGSLSSFDFEPKRNLMF